MLFLFIIQEHKKYLHTIEMSLLPDGPQGPPGPPGPQGPPGPGPVTITAPTSGGLIFSTNSWDITRINLLVGGPNELMEPSTPVIKKILLNTTATRYSNADSKGRGFNFPIIRNLLNEGSAFGITSSAYDPVRNLIFLGGDFRSTPDGYASQLCVYNPLTGKYGKLLNTAGLEGPSSIGSVVYSLAYVSALDTLFIGSNINTWVANTITARRFTRYTITSYNATTGDLTGTFAPAPTGTSFPTNGIISCAKFISNYIWVGGTTSTTPYTGRLGLYNVNTNAWTQPGSTGVINSPYVNSSQPNTYPVAVGVIYCAEQVGGAFGDVYVGGSFSSSGTANLNNICRIGNLTDINPANWTYNALGFGVNGRVNAIAPLILPNNNLVVVVGGDFNGVWANSSLTDLVPNTTNIAMWNTVTNAWVSMADYTFNGPVNALHIMNPGTTANFLVVGGAFTADNTGNGSYARMARYFPAFPKFIPWLGVVSSGANDPSQTYITIQTTFNNRSANPRANITTFLQLGVYTYITGSFSGGVNMPQYAGNAGIIRLDLQSSIQGIALFKPLSNFTPPPPAFRIEGVDYDRIIIVGQGRGKSITLIYKPSIQRWIVASVSPGLLLQYSR
jgi:hypothetical protein